MHKGHLLRFFSLVLFFISFCFFTTPTYATTDTPFSNFALTAGKSTSLGIPEGQDDLFYHNNIMFYAWCPNGSGNSFTCDSVSGNQITWIGDSYSEKIENENTVKEKFSGIYYNGQSGRMFASDSPRWGASGLNIIKNEIKNSLRDYLVFALGTNTDAGSKDAMSSQIKDLVDTVKKFNSNTKIILVAPITNNDAARSTYDGYHEAMKEASETYDNIILADWYEAAKDHLNEYFDDHSTSAYTDNSTHPNNKGYEVWLQTIYDAIPSDCGSIVTSGDTAEEKIWTGLRRLGLTAVQTAGILGNMKNECRLSPVCWEDIHKSQWGTPLRDLESRGEDNRVGIGLPGFTHWKHIGNLADYMEAEANDIYHYLQEDAPTYGSLTGDQLIAKLKEEHGDSMGDMIANRLYSIQLIYIVDTINLTYDNHSFKYSHPDYDYSQYLSATNGDSAMEARKAALWWEENYEIHKGDLQGARQDDAEEVYNKYKDMQVSSIPSGSTSSTTTSSSSSSNNDENCDFPQIYQVAGDGCGPTSIAMLVSALTGEDVTESDITNLVAPSKYSQTRGSTSTTLTEKVGEKYKLEVKNVPVNENDKSDVVSKIKQYLNDGYMIHISGQGTEPFSDVGHFIGLYTIDGDRVFTANSAKVGNKWYELTDLINAGYHGDAFTAIRNPNSSGKKCGKSSYTTLDECGNQEKDTSCTSNGQIIADKAEELAWPENTDKQTTKQSGTPAFQSAATATGTDGTDDCLTFVKTVIIASGADTDYPKASASNGGKEVDVENYMINSDKWEEQNVTDESGLQPGDVIISADRDAYNENRAGNNHIFIYVGNGKVAAANLNQWYGRIENLEDEWWNGGKAFYYGNTKYKVFRIKGGGDCGQGGLTEEQAQKLADYYNSDAINASEYSLPSGKTNCVSFSAFFVQHFTNLGLTHNSIWTTNGGASSTVKYLHEQYNFNTSSDPKMYSVFSVKWGSTMCGSQLCGHTGVIVGKSTDNDNFITVEASYPSTPAQVKVRSLSELTDSYGDPFAHTTDKDFDFNKLNEIVK